MVRLKLLSRDAILETHRVFQSHNGSIKTLLEKFFDIILYIFQSHNGSIKTGSVLDFGYGERKFQSHNGSIKTKLIISLQWLLN